MDAIKKLPGCVGEYEEGDQECNGDIAGERPCAWRDMCGAFAQFMADRGEEREEYLDTVEDDDGNLCCQAAVSNEEFAEFCETLVGAYRVECGMPTCELTREQLAAFDGDGDDEGDDDATGDDASGTIGSGRGHSDVGHTKTSEDANTAVRGQNKEKLPGTREQQAARRARRKRSEKVKQRHNDLADMFEQFYEQLVEQFPDRCAAKAKHAAALGQLYTIDKRSPSGYISVYIKTPRGRDAALCLLKPKARSMRMDAELPLTPERFNRSVSKVTRRKLKAAPYDDGVFKMLIKELDKERLGLLAETIGTLAGKGIIKMATV